MISPFRWRLLGLCLLLATSPVSAQAKKLPYPSPAEFQKVNALYQEIFAADLAAAKAPADRAKLAQFLSGQLRENRDEPVQTAFLLEQIINLATQGGDVFLALSALEDLDKLFAIDAAQMKVKLLTSAAASAPGPESAKILVDLALGMVQETLDAGQYPQAAAFARIAELAADRTGLDNVVVQVKQRRQWVDAIHQGHQRLGGAIEALKKNPQDGPANAVAGLFFGPLRGQWDKGIPLLANATPGPLQELARKDDAKPTATKDQLALGNEWWNLAQNEKDPVLAWGFQSRSAYWYDLAVAQLSGLHRALALRRIDLVQQRSVGFLRTQTLPIQVGEIKKWDAGTEQIKAVAFSGDGRFVISAGMDKAVHVWELPGLKEEKVLNGHTNQIYSIAVHPLQRQVFSGSWDRFVIAWDLRTGKELQRFTHEKDVNGIALSRDGSKLLAGCDDKNAYLWNTTTGKLLKSFPGHSGFVLATAFSPNDRYLATGGNDRFAKVWNADTGDLITTFSQHQTSAITGLVFTPDSRYVVSCGDETPRMWDALSGKEIQKFVGHDRIVTAIALSPDGKRLLTGSDDNSIRVWEVATGKQIHRFDGHTDYVTSVKFSRDGLLALSGSRDRTVRIWGIPYR